MTYTFELQDGVKFHDGTDFNADAVCYNYNRWNNFTGALASPDYAYYYGAVFGGFGKDSNLDSCKASSASEVVIKLKHPYTSFLLSQTITTFTVNSRPPSRPATRTTRIPPEPVRPGGKGAMAAPARSCSRNGSSVTTSRSSRTRTTGTRPAAHLDAVTFKPIADPTQRSTRSRRATSTSPDHRPDRHRGASRATAKLQVIDRG